jgi:hypothetical protein
VAATASVRPVRDVPRRDSCVCVCVQRTEQQAEAANQQRLVEYFGQVTGPPPPISRPQNTFTREPRSAVRERGRRTVTGPPLRPFDKLFRAFALRRTGLVNEIKNKLQYT